jgi:hypothetical protein
MLAAPTLFGRPMSVDSAGISGNRRRFKQDGGKIAKTKEHPSPWSKAYISHLPPS